MLALALKLSRIYSAEETQEILSSKTGVPITKVRIPEPPRKKRPMSAKVGAISHKRGGSTD